MVEAHDPTEVYGDTAVVDAVDFRVGPHAVEPRVVLRRTRGSLLPAPWQAVVGFVGCLAVLAVVDMFLLCRRDT